MKQLLLAGTRVWLASAPQAHAVVVTIGATPSNLAVFDDAPAADVNSSSMTPPVYLGIFTDFGYTFSPVGSQGGYVVKGGVHVSGSTAMGGNNGFTAVPENDLSNYMAVSNGPKSFEKIGFASTQSFSIYWGSIGPGNEIDFFDGTTEVGSITGAGLVSADPGLIDDNGVHTDSKANLFLTFSGMGNINSVVLKSTNPSFEFDLAPLPVTRVPTAPEASTWGMMLIGFAGLGIAGYRRAKASTMSAR
jgi:hypothetical protein